MTITAYRSGETAPHWTDDCYKETLTHGTDQILFTLSMPSKGGGVTEVQLRVTSESFEALVRACGSILLDYPQKLSKLRVGRAAQNARCVGVSQ